MIKRLSVGIKKIHHNEQGQGMAEYGLIIALVAVLAIAGFQLLGRSLGGKIEGVADTIQNSK